MCGIVERKEMINRNSDVSISRQAELLGFSRGMIYYTPKPISESDLALMHAIDKLHMAHPLWLRACYVISVNATALTSVASMYAP